MPRPPLLFRFFRLYCGCRKEPRRRRKAEDGWSYWSTLRSFRPGGGTTWMVRRCGRRAGGVGTGTPLPGVSNRGKPLFPGSFRQLSRLFRETMVSFLLFLGNIQSPRRDHNLVALQWTGFPLILSKGGRMPLIFPPWGRGFLHATHKKSDEPLFQGADKQPQDVFHRERNLPACERNNSADAVRSARATGIRLVSRQKLTANKVRRLRQTTRCETAKENTTRHVDHEQVRCQIHCSLPGSGCRVEGEDQRVPASRRRKRHLCYSPPNGDRAGVGCRSFGRRQLPHRASGRAGEHSGLAV